jgi:HK97 family phage major capsid protein
MLGAAMQKAIVAGDKAAAASFEKAMESVTALMDKVTEVATSKSKGLQLPTQHSASFDAKAVQEKLASMKKSAGSVAFEIKNKADLEYFAKATSKTDLTGDVIEPDRQPEVTRDPVRSPFMEDIADTSETNSDYVSWVEVVTETGAPATTAELATMPEKDFAFQEFKKPIEKVTVTNKHSVELLSDAPQLVNEIRNWLNEDLNIVTDTQLLSGNGTTPNLQGVLGVATTLDGTAIGTQRIANANKFDVLRIAMTKIITDGKGKFIPNFVVLNPADTETLDLTKNADGDYIMPPFYSANGMLIKGARVIENTAITAGTFLVGDFRKLHVRRKGGVEIEITNSDGTDFVKDIITVKLRRRLTSYTRGNDDGAFRTGSFATCIAALVAA